MGSSTPDLSRWMNARLTEVLGFPADEVTQYVLSMDSKADQDSHLLEMLDPADPNHAMFVEEFRKRRGDDDGGGIKSPPGMKAYRKDKENLADAPKKGKKAADAPPTFTMEGKRGKTKFVSLYSADGAAKDAATIKGRHM